MNGNSLQNTNSTSERKKSRRKNAQNCITYEAQKVPGHRDEIDIDNLVNFIENKDKEKDKDKDVKGKKGKTSTSTGTSSSSSSNSIKVKAAQASSTNKLSRSPCEGKDKIEEVSGLLQQKSNSLEEISKISKLEDLTDAVSSDLGAASANNGKS